MDKKKLVNLLSHIEHIQAAILFGSECNGTATKDSDIDIALLYEPEHVPDPFETLMLRQQLGEKMGQDLDIVLLNHASPIIAMQTVKNGMPLLINDKKAYDTFEIRLITDYADVKRMREPFEKNILKRKLHD